MGLVTIHEVTDIRQQQEDGLCSRKFGDRWSIYRSEVGHSRRYQNCNNTEDKLIERAPGGHAVEILYLMPQSSEEEA